MRGRKACNTHSGLTARCGATARMPAVPASSAIADLCFQPVTGGGPRRRYSCAQTDYLAPTPPGDKECLSPSPERGREHGGAFCNPIPSS